MLNNSNGVHVRVHVHDRLDQMPCYSRFQEGSLPRPILIPTSCPCLHAATAMVSETHFQIEDQIAKLHYFKLGSFSYFN